jgi:hypothetical protein
MKRSLLAATAAFFAVTASAVAAPTPNFSVSPNPAVRTQVTTFTSTGTCDRPPCTYRWFRGTSSAAADEIERGAAQPNTTAQFTFTNNGVPVGSGATATVTLRVRNRSGQERSRTRTFGLVEPASPPPPPPPPPPSGGFPDESNTGVPPGTTLTPSGGMTITQAGTVIDARAITGSITVNAPNVTIRRSVIRSNAFNVIKSNSTGLVVEDSEIVNQPVSGQPNCHNAIAFGGYTMRRVESTGCENGADMGGGNVVVEDSYIHDLDGVGPSHVFGNGDPHTDGLQAQGGGDNIVVRHNYISPQDSGPGQSTAGIIMAHGSNPNNNTRIEDNLIDGSHAGYAMYAPRVQASNVFINRNRMRRGVWGYTACVRLGVTVTEFNGNVDDGTGVVLSPDNGAGNSCNT